MVITDVNQITYNGDGVTTAWPFTFPIIDNTDLKLTLINAAGARTDITSDYYVDMVNNTVYYPGYAPGAEPPEANQPPKVQSGEKLEIYRRVPVNQLADLGEKWPFNVIEKGLDKLTMICQDIYSWIGRNIVGLTEDGTSWDARNLPISNVGGPVNVDDAATKDYVDRILNGFVLEGDSRTVPFDNVAQMKASDIEAGQIACTLGYQDVNDGSAGVYNIRAKTPYDVNDEWSIIFLDNGNVAELIQNNHIFSLDSFSGITNEEKLHNALKQITSGTIICGDIVVTQSFDVAQNATDYRQITISGANITIDSVPMFISSKPDSLASADNSVPSFSNCYIKGNNSTMLFGAFNVITTKFDSCKIVSCPLFNSATHFVQSLFLNNTDILLMHTDMVTALRLYNFNMANSRVEWGNGKLFYLYGENGNSIANGAISNCLIEGRTDSIIYTKGGFLPLVIENCYFEGNAFPYVEIDPTIPGTQAHLFIRGNYFDLDNGSAGDYVFKFGNARTSSLCLFEYNAVLKTTAGTIYISDVQEMSTLFLKKIVNTLPSNVLVTRYPENFEMREYKPVVDGSNLVVEIPINKFSNLWMTYMVLDIDFFGMRDNQSSVVANDYIHLKVALLSRNASTVSPYVVSEFKTTNDVSVTPTVINDAYNSKNGILKLEFSGFNTSDITYSICKVTNNNLSSQWEA